MTLACRGAVRRGRSLRGEESLGLLEDVRNPCSLCRHRFTSPRIQVDDFADVEVVSTTHSLMNS